MLCPNCGERLVRKSREDPTAAILLGRFVVLRKGQLSVACSKCRTIVQVTKPLMLKMDNK